MKGKDSKFDVIVVGLNTVDILMILPDKIVADGKHIVKDMTMQGGAPVGSGVSALTRLGYRGGYVARLGDNPASLLSLGEFAANNISDELVVRDKTSMPAVAVVEIDRKTSARTVFIMMENYGYVRKADIPVSAIKNSRLLWVDSYDLDATEAAVKAASGSPCRVLMDFESGDKKRMLGLLKYGTDIVFPLECAKFLSGKKDAESALRALSRHTSAQLVATDGVNGSWALSEGKIIHQAAFLVKNPVDSTGCGDAFHAGYAMGILEGWPLEMRMECGAFIASLVVQKLGGRTALPFKKDLPKVLDKRISRNLREALLKISKR